MMDALVSGGLQIYQQAFCNKVGTGQMLLVSQLIVQCWVVTKLLYFILKATPETASLNFCIAGNLRLNHIPEPGSMVLLYQVSQFMPDDGINHEHRCFDEIPVEIQVIVRGA
jgi:predicted ABC-type sugar transport system permease subunit